MPVKVLRLEVQGEHVRQNRVHCASDIASRVGIQIARRSERAAAQLVEPLFRDGDGVFGHGGALMRMEGLDPRSERSPQASYGRATHEPCHTDDAPSVASSTCDLLRGPLLRGSSSTTKVERADQSLSLVAANQERYAEQDAAKSRLSGSVQIQRL